jgi:hypothetical protein
MAFLIICRFEIEQRIAIDEQLSSSTHSQTKRALHLSLVANNIRVKEWIDIALGRKREISGSEIDDSETIVASANYDNDEANSRVIDAWKINYYFVLKAVEIWKSSNDSLNNACKYIHWMKEEWLFSSAPSIFAMVLFSPNRYPKMIKNINSHSKQKLIHGIQNAAWDLTFIRGWSNFYQSSNLNRLWLLCSNDTALRSITKMLFEDSEQSENSVLEQLQKYWPVSDAQRIYDVYKQARADNNNDNDNRQEKIKDRIKSLDNSIVDLETKLVGT